MNEIDPILPGEVDDDSPLNVDDTVSGRPAFIVVPEHIFCIQPELLRIGCFVNVFFVKILDVIALASPVPADFNRIQDQYKSA